MPLNPSQELAASVRGRPVLVSAAAGSGKTRVLVERLMRYVDEGADIDDFLVITYTRAAAAELRSRILRELNSRLAARPGSRRLIRQTELCARAGIGTIDSICGRLLREYVHLTGLTPDFRVMEEERSENMKRSVLSRLLDEAYETLEEDRDFRALVDSVGAGRDDGRLEALTLQLYDALRSHPHPDEWMEECRRTMAQRPGADAGGTVWGEYLLSRGAQQAAYWAARLETLQGEMAQPGHEALNRAYGEGFAAAAEGLRSVLRAAAMGWDKTAAAFPVPMKIKAFRGEDELKERAKTAWDDCRAACRKLEAEFSDPSALLLEELEQTRPAMEALLDLTKRLDRAYAAEKRRQGLVDFSDQEHMVLALLEDEKSGMAADLDGRWREVMVDEYQDVNDCQDRLFTLLSGQGQRLFLVGDVKQSIYRFRLANPGIFLRKYRDFAPVEDTPESTAGGRILLRENYRSAEGVLQCTNDVFKNLMSRELGELDYDEQAQLIHGRSELPEALCPAAQFHILALPETPDGEERPEKTALEAAMTARLIRELVESGELIPDGERMRPVRYGDIAILLRSVKVPGARFRAALAAEGIPAVAQQGGGFFRSLEVTVLLSLLAVIDNPRQDVPLIAVLRSPIYGFTPDELAAIRAADRGSDFYTALLACREEPHCARFLAELEEYRALAPEKTVAELLGRICARSEVYALLSAMTDGEQRRENLQLLLDYAHQYEQTGYRGLFGFVNWMKRLSERGEEPRSGESGQENAVQIMSVHHSKGLEYPVVFLCNTARQFNRSDLRPAVLVHPQLGLGAKVTDVQRGTEYPGLAWRAVAARLRQENLSEELRVLYVAMTRARERLYITAAWSKPEEKLRDLAAELASPVPPPLLEGDNSLSLWLARCALLCPSSLELHVQEAEGRGKPRAEEEKEEKTPAPGLHIEEKLRWHYPWQAAQTLPSKLTASELKAGELPEEDLQRPAEPLPAARLPELSGEEKPLSGSERGSAVHLALQFIDYGRTDSEEAIAAELERLEAAGHITPRQHRAIRADWLLRFFRSPLGIRIRQADRLWREQRFTLLMDAKELCGGPEGEEILFQGVVDCCIEEAGELTIIDYKTDYVTAETLPERAEHYAPQLRSYAAAMERVMGKKVRGAQLFFLQSGVSVEVPLDGSVCVPQTGRERGENVGT